ncbi:MAG: hypothetical protein ACOZAN_00915 [Patescibacteria group bacterium]
MTKIPPSVIKRSVAFTRIRAALIMRLRRVRWLEALFLLGTIIVAIVLSIPDLGKDMQIEVDAYIRSLDAMKKFENHDLQNSFTWMWLPWHASIMALGLFLHKSFFTLRIETLIIASLIPAVIFKYAQIFSNNRTKKTAIAVTSAILAIFLPIRLIYSTTTLTEPVFALFFLSSIYFLFKNKPNFLLAIISLNIAHGIRYESWYLLPIIILYIMVGNRNIPLWQRLSVSVFSMAFPIFYMYQYYEHAGSALGFFFEKKNFAQLSPIPHFGNLQMSFFAWWHLLVASVSPTILLLAAVGTFALKKTLKTLLLIAMPLVAFISLVVQVYLGTMEWFPIRYLYFIELQLLPLSCLGIFRISQMIDQFTSLAKMLFLSQIVQVIMLFFVLFGLVFSYKSVHNYTFLNPDYFIPGIRPIIEVITRLKQDSPQRPVRYFISKQGYYNDPFVLYFLDIETLRKAEFVSDFDPTTINNELIIYQKLGEQNYINVFLENGCEIIYHKGDFFLLEKQHSFVAN